MNYSFGKENISSIEAEKILKEMIKQGEFDDIIYNEIHLDKDYIIERVCCEEAYTLGFNDEIMLDSITSNENEIEEIENEEKEKKCLVFGCGSIESNDEYGDAFVEKGGLLSMFIWSDIYQGRLLYVGLGFGDCINYPSKYIVIK